MTSVHKGFFSSPVRLVVGVACALVVAVAVPIAVFVVEGSKVLTSVFSRVEIQAATRAGSSLGPGDESRTIVQEYVAREHASGHSILSDDVNIAVVRSKDGKTTVRLVWSGSRNPTGLLVVSRGEASRLALAVGLTAITPTGLPATPLQAPINRQAYGGAAAEGGLGIVRSDCIDAWITTQGVPMKTSSCAELWHGPQTPEWMYHHFGQGNEPRPTEQSVITAMSIRSRIVKDQRADVAGPKFVSSCSNTGQTSVLAGLVKNGQDTYNPAIHMRSNPCTGYLDFINQSEWQTGAGLRSTERNDASIETTGVYSVDKPDLSPAWEDYVWTQVGCRNGDSTLHCRFGSLDESSYIKRLW
ncbi:hypothetical protein [Dactylosporangium salmoneum]